MKILISPSKRLGTTVVAGTLAVLTGAVAMADAPGGSNRVQSKPPVIHTRIPALQYDRADADQQQDSSATAARNSDDRLLAYRLESNEDPPVWYGSRDRDRRPERREAPRTERHDRDRQPEHREAPRAEHRDRDRQPKHREAPRAEHRDRDRQPEHREAPRAEHRDRDRQQGYRDDSREERPVWYGNRYRSDHRDRYREEHHEHRDPHRYYYRGRYHDVPRDRVRYYREVVVVRPYGHWYSGYGHYHHDDDAFKWLAFTAITLGVLNYLSEAQQREHEAAQIAATTAPIGERIVWDEGGAQGSVVATREGTSTSGRYCREFQQEVMVGGRREQAYGTACRNPDGSWEVVTSGE